MRVRGKIGPVEGFEPLSGQQTREVVYNILNDDQRKRFDAWDQINQIMGDAKRKLGEKYKAQF